MTNVSSGVRVGLSSASVYPEPVDRAFELAAELGYDGLELMVWTDAQSQDPERIRQLSHKYGVDVLSVHSPCLLITQRVWGVEPWGKVRRSIDAATRLGATTVVVHPPFRWQRRYAARFRDEIRRLEDATGVRIAVENMFPVYLRGQAISTYAPGWDVTTQDYRHYTLDTSHTSVSRSDALAFARSMGERLTHVHIGDGTGQTNDEHLIPGRGTQPCAQLLGHLAETGYAGYVIVEVSTRTALSAEHRAEDLVEALAFTRTHLGQPV